MNRIIKFRAWDVNQMQDWKYLKTWTFSDIEHSGVKVMQFTGLTDKNGKEIYEGDILLDEYKEDGKLEKQFNKVVWCNECALYEWILIGSDADPDSHDFNLSKESAQELVIIGNIYENPELLK